MEKYQEKKKIENLFVVSLCLLTIVFFMFQIIACQTTQSIQPIKPSTSASPSPLVINNYLPLSWEKTSEAHPERAPWSNKLSSLIDKDFAIFDKAQDITFFCSKYSSLDKPHKIKALGDVFVGVAYYESGFKIDSQSVDVGVKSNKDTWSIGLFQMSVVDQENYKLSLHYSFNDLITALPNIELAETIMKIQIQKQGLFRVDHNVYWATLKPSGKYDESNNIKKWVLKYDGFCN